MHAMNDRQDLQRASAPSLAGRAARSIAYRAAWRMPAPTAADLVIDLLVNRRVNQNLSDRQIGLLAHALAHDSFLTSRMMDRAPVRQAAAIAAEQFAQRGLINHLSVEATEALADSLAQADFATRLFERLSDADAGDIAFHQLVSRHSIDRLTSPQSQALAAKLAPKRDFLQSLLTHLDPRDAADLAAGQLIARNLLGQLSAQQQQAFAAALAPSPGFATRVLAHLSPADAAATLIDQAVERGTLAALSETHAHRLAGVLAERGGFASHMLEALSEGDAAVVLSQLLERDLFQHLTLAQSRRTAAELAAQPGFASLVLDELSDPAAAAVLGQLINRDLSAHITKREAEQLLLRTPDEDAAAAAASVLTKRALAPHVSQVLSDRLAEQFARRPGFAHTVFAQLDIKQAAEVAIEGVLTRDMLGKLEPSQARRFARAAFGEPALVNEFGAISAETPLHLLHAMAGVLARNHPDVLDEEMRRAQPEAEFRAESYSQEGEDLVLARMFDGQPAGFYVDVGALHPIRFSNTHLLYRRGWRGINIDATPGSMEAFQKWRPRDVNIECLVSTETGSRPYYVFNEPALNTMSEDLAQQRSAENALYRVVQTMKLRARPLSDILDEHLPPGQSIDYFTIDVEGADLEVLKSNDWTRYRPKLVIAELLATDLSELGQHEVSKFLAAQGYRPIAKQHNSVFFQTIAQPAAARQNPRNVTAAKPRKPAAPTPAAKAPADRPA